jgi:hypothetical protein
MPLDEMTIALLRLAVSSLDCCADAIVWNRAVANIETDFWAGRMSGSSSAVLAV